MTNFKKILSIPMVMAILAFSGQAQTTTTQTTLSSALSGSNSGATSSASQTVCVASSTGISAPGFNNNTALTMLLVDKEAMIVNASTPSTTCWSVTRGWGGTKVMSHASGAVVWVGPTGGFGGSPFANNPPVAGTPCTAANEAYLPVLVAFPDVGYQNQIGWAYNCGGTSGLIGYGVWTAVKLPIGSGSQGVDFYLATDTGGSNAITASIPGLPQVQGVCVQIQLAHTLQAGTDTFALNGATAVGIKSHYNTSNNIGTAYASTGLWSGCFNGSLWLDTSE